MSTGTLCRGFSVACGGRYKLKPISQFVVVALWVNLSSLPPKDAIVAFVWTDIVGSPVEEVVSGGFEGLGSILEVCRMTFLVSG